MQITRAEFLKGAALVPALLPMTAYAATQQTAQFPVDPANSIDQWRAIPTTGEIPLRFAVVGDNTGMARPGVFDQAMVQLSWLRPDFVISVGDLIEGYTDDRRRLDAQWAGIEASAAKLGCPIVYAAGNHDLNSQASRDSWRQWRGEASYYSFTFKGALFLILSTEEGAAWSMPAELAKSYYDAIDAIAADPANAGKLLEDFGAANGHHAAMEDSDLIGKVNFGEPQLRWLKETLAKNPNPRWTFVVLHRPVWKNGNSDFKFIQEMLSGQKYTVFAGHTHYFTHEVVDGQDYINMGTTGGFRVKEGPGLMDHTMMVTLTPAGPSYANVRLKGLMSAAGETGQVFAY